MSNLPGNPYARSIEQIDTEVGDRKFSPNVAHALMQSKLVSATLALAYEQRTVALIALAQLNVSANGSNVDLRTDVAEITERLGMRAEE